MAETHISAIPMTPEEMRAKFPGASSVELERFKEEAFKIQDLYLNERAANDPLRSRNKQLEKQAGEDRKIIAELRAFNGPLWTRVRQLERLLTEILAEQERLLGMTLGVVSRMHSGPGSLSHYTWESIQPEFLPKTASLVADGVPPRPADLHGA